MNQLKLFLFFTFFFSTTQAMMAQVGGFVVSEPDSLDGTINYIALSTGWGTPATGICADVVLMQDSAGANLGCLPNVGSLAGKIALVFRGTCGFSFKVLTAQEAGAIGVLIANSATGTIPGAMAGGPEAPQVNIPAALISNADGLRLQAALAAGATVTGCMTLPNVEVTFLVDASEEIVDPAGITLLYSVEGGAPQTSQMTSLGNGLYGDTLSVPATSEIEYVFVNGGPATGAETVPAACGVGDSLTGFSRYVFAGVGGSDLEKVCFGKCTRCQTVVTIQVNMGQQPISPDGVHIAGNFQGWNPTTTPMVDAGDSIYTYTLVAVPGDTLLYKFINGDSFDDAETGITAECGDPDGFGGFNRIFIVPNLDSVTLAQVCFDSCGACPSSLCHPDAIICDDFESYALGGINAQSVDWDTWDGTGGDGIVTEEQASSGTQSMEIDFTLPGATQDVILLLGDSTSGNYLLQWNMYVPTGKKAYYNIQHDLDPHVWAFDVMFNANGEGEISIGNPAVALGSFEYDYDEWFLVQHYIDIDNDVVYAYIDSVYAGAWRFSQTSGTGAPATSDQLAGVDFYPIDATYQNYVDDVQFIKLDAGVASDLCASAANIDSLFGQPIGQVVNSGLFDNTGANTVGDPETGFECFGEPDGAGATPSLENTVWFTFTGDGNRYFIETGPCGSANPVTDGDTQMAIYEGPSCGHLTPLLCNEDGPSAVSGGPYPAGDTLETVDGQVYFILIDGFNFQGALSVGEFCLRVKQVAPLVGSNEPVFDQSIRLAPNPTAGVTNLLVALPEAADLTIRVTNSLGQTVIRRTENNIQEGTVQLDLSRFGQGLYFVDLSDGVNHSTRRLIVGNNK